MGHAPSKIAQISVTFKDSAPFPTASHGGGTLVVCGCYGGGSPGVKPASFSSIHIYLLYMHVICYIIWFMALI
jgi:hypothetical protein